jgi:hypothetical protein
VVHAACYDSHCGTAANPSAYTTRDAGKVGTVNCNDNEAGYQQNGDLWCCTPYYLTPKDCPCTPSATCSGCTPSCPSGTSSTVSGDLCTAGNASCTGSNGCNSCTVTGNACYYPETNTKFTQSNGSTSQPASISIIVDGVTYQLSQDPNNPTVIKLPYKNSTNVKVSVPTFTAPTTSRGGGYYFKADNYGTSSDNWQGWVGCSGVAGEDFCIDGGTSSGSNTVAFTPTSLPISSVLKEGASGQISGMYYTVDKCDNEKKYSLPVQGYYTVDTEPTILNCSTAIQDLSSDKTVKQCTSTTYTGKEINNPLHLKFTTTDINGASDIQGFVAWFSKDSSVPTIVMVSGTNPNEDVANDMGIFIKKNGSSWSNPNIYGYDSTSQHWELTSDGTIKNKGGETFLKVENISVTTSGNNVTFDFYLEYDSVTTNPQGLYTLYAAGIDTAMINSSAVDTSRISSCLTWGFDLKNPSAADIVKTIQDEYTLNIKWGVSDSETDIKKAIINAYRVGGITTGTAELFLQSGTSKGRLSLGPEPTDLNNIGRYDSTSSQAWIFNNPSTATQQNTLDIRNNEAGKISLYVTAYDEGCNTNSVTTDINLNSWFATRGGLIYSNGGISTQAVDVSGVTALNGVFKNTYLTPSSLDLGTEILMARNQSISSLIHSADSGAVRAYSVYDSNDTKGYWFDTLKARFNTELSDASNTLTSFAVKSTDKKVSDSCNGNNCYMYSLSDINIPSGYVCDRPTIFISEGNIDIEPDITSTPNLNNQQNASGCIFLAKNNITVGAGSYKSTTKTAYDYIDGFLIADNQIIFPLEDQSQNMQDGIEISGSLLAFGTSTASSDSAISLQRNLGLLNQLEPTLVLSYDNKYGAISEIFLGKQAPLYKQEVGFKSF